MIRIFAAILLLCTTAQATIITATNVAYASVLAAVTSANHGDTVVVPAGTATWTNTLTFSKAITLQGAGTNSTIIVNGQTASGNVGDQCIMSITLVTNGLTKLTGFQFDGNTNGNGIYINTHEFWNVGWVENCLFKRITPQALTFDGLIAGLADQCTFVDNVNDVVTYANITIPVDQMNGSWTNALTLGTTNCVVFEDLQFLYETWYPSTTAATSSSGLGARRVIRYCAWTNHNQNLGFSPMVDAHGNQQPVSTVIQPLTSGLTNTHRGTRQFEWYNCSFVDTTTNLSRFVNFSHFRGGTGVVFGNTFAGLAAKLESPSSMWKVQEEDAPYDFDFVTAPPGMDKSTLYFGTNTVNGVNNTGIRLTNPGDAPYFVLNTDYFWSMPPGYVPLVYPHPLRSLPPASAPVVITGRAALRGGVKLRVSAP